MDSAEHLALRVAQDDYCQTPPSSWLPKLLGADDKKIPHWLYHWNFSVGARDAASVPKNLQRCLPDSRYLDVNAMAFTGAWFCYAQGRTLYCFQVQRGYKVRLDLPERAQALTLLQVRDGVLYGVAGCSDQSLNFFCVKPNEHKLTVDKTWRKDETVPARADYFHVHILETIAYGEYPCALSLVDNTPQTDLSGYSTYDLLVIDRSGRLAQRRFMESKRLPRLWERCTARLGLTNPDEIFQREKVSPSWNEQRGAALAYAALVACLPPSHRRSAPISAEQRGERMAALLEMLRRFRSERHFPARIWRRLVSPPQAGSAESAGFQIELLQRLYTEELSQLDRRRVVNELAGKAWRPFRRDPRLQHLRAEIEAGNWHATAERPLVKLGELLAQWSNDFYVDGVLPRLRFPKAVTPNNVALLEWDKERSNGKRLLVAAADKKLYGFEPSAKRSPSRIREFTANYAIECLLALPGNAHADLALIERDNQQRGTLHLLRIEPTVDGGRANIRDSLALECVGYSHLLCAAAGAADSVLLAVLINRGRHAELILCDIGAGRARLGAAQTLCVPWLHSADLAYDGSDGYRLIVASHQAPITWLYRWRGGEPCREERPFNIMQRGVNTVAFSSRRAPRWLLAGGGAGSLWCADLAAADDTAELHWTGRLDGPVTFVRALPDGQSFLAGTSSKYLYLLRVGQGQWERRIHLPGVVETAAVSADGKHGWVLVHGAGLFELHFPDDGEQQELLQKIGREWQRLEDDSRSLWRIDAPARAICRLAWAGETQLEVLENTAEEEARTALLRYLLKTERLNQADKIYWAEHVRLHELQALLNPGAAEPEVLKAVIVRLQREMEPDDMAARAMLAVLHHLAGRKPTLAQLRDTVPARYVQKHYCVARELARLLLQATREQHGMGEVDVLATMLPTLCHLPLNTVSELVNLARPAAVEQQSLDSLAVLLDIGHRVGEIETALTVLEQRFTAAEQHSELNRLTAALLRFHRLCWQHRPGEHSQWIDWRARALFSLSNLMRAVHADWAPDPPKAALLDNLRASLVNLPPPQDCEPREQGIAWVEAARRHLEFGALTAPTTTTLDWEALLWRLVELTRLRLHALFRHEHQYQMALVRPRMELLEILPLEDNRLRLRLRATPETANRPLAEVSIIYRCLLHTPGHIEERRAYLAYPPPLPSEDFTFEGFIAPNQTQLAVEVKLVGAKGYRNTTLWRFTLPKRQRGAEKKDWPPALEQIYADYRNRLFGLEAVLVVAVIDQAMGYDALLQEWDAQPGVRRVNLDQRLAEVGPGRRYANRALDVDTLLEPLLQDISRTSIGAQRDKSPLWLLAPLDETLERLLLAGASDTVQAWLGRLRQLAEATPAYRLRLIVSSRHAARLRALGVTGVIEAALHRHVQHAGNGTLRDKLRELLMERYASSARQAETWLEALGWDLRLVSRWLKNLEQRRQALDFGDFLQAEDNRALLRADLASLGVLELVTAMVGAVSHCQVLLQHAKAGQYAARDYLSTTRGGHAPKLLQRSGSPFGGDSLARLRADAAPPSHLLLEGFGIGVGGESSRTGLLPMLILRRKELETVFQRLAELGLGHYVGGVFRTASPYREYIAACYAESGLQDADSRVLSSLAGVERDPGELLRPNDLTDAPKDSVGKFLPNSAPKDRDALRAIARVWRADASAEEVAQALRRLFPDVQMLAMSSATARWIAPLQEFSLIGLGLGRVELHRTDDATTVVEPEDYLFWLAGAAHFDDDAFRRTVAECLAARQPWLKSLGYQADTHIPKILLSGPGVEALSPDPSRSVALWRFADYARAAWRGGLVERLWGRARAQLRLSAFSPYRTSGGLPPGSPLFVGREKELDFIRRKLPVASILVVGCRRVGKTSLLNRVLYEFRDHAVMLPIFLDLQGIRQRTAFLAALHDAVERFHYAERLPDLGETGRHDARRVLENLALALKSRGRLLVLLLNEVDGLAEHDKELLEVFRGLNDRDLARFLFVGYAVIRQLGEIDKPLFHFTEGLHLGGKAISLAELSPDAAERLLDQLTAPPLGLRWRSAAERKLAHAELLARSYRIPWVLQRYGKMLVEYLEEQRREEIALEDVNRLLHDNGNVVWEYINQIDYTNLGYQGSEKVQKPGFLIILYALARKFYFKGGDSAPIRDPKLPQRRALDLGFHSGEVLEAVRESAYMLLKDDERQAFMDWFARLDLNQALKLLTLTLILEPDPVEIERYCFLLHIFPAELYRLHGQNDPTLDNLIIKETVNFLNITQLKEMH